MENVYLAHHGVKGQKWGVRRYQNPDGTLTDAGKERFSKGVAGFRKRRREHKIEKIDKRIDKAQTYLNNPKTQQRLAKANARNAKYNQRVSEYERAQNRADRAYIFRGMKQRRADKAYRRMMRANKPSSQRFVANYKNKEYKLAANVAKRDKTVNKYVNKYGSESYEELMRRLESNR